MLNAPFKTVGSAAGTLLTGLGVALLGVATPASAATVGTTLSVTATVTANCTVSTSPVAFGNVNTLSGSNVDASGGGSVSCTNGTGWTATAGAGGGTGATLASRRMTAGSNTLTYNLYTDSARSTVWGDGTGSTGTVTNTGTGSAQAFSIYGRVPLGQSSVPAGSYSDTVAVTVTY